MQPPSRRGFLSGSIATLTALASQRALADDAAATRWGPAPEDDPDALELIPAAGDVELTYLTLLRADLSDVSSPEELGYQSRRILDRIGGLSAETVDEVVSIRTRNGGLVGSAVGSFDRFSAGETVEERGDWRIADDGTVVTASVDGQVAFVPADSDAATAFVGAAIEAAAGDAEDVLEADGDAATTYDVLSDRTLAYYIPDVSRGPFDDFEGVEAVAAGFDQPPNRIQDGAENAYLLFTDPDASLGDEAIERIASELEPAEIEELRIDRREEYVRIRTVVERPPQRDREAAPSARVRTDRDGDSLTFEHVDGEAVDTDHLQLWVDGELADRQPGDEFETFAAGDRFEVTVDPVSTVTLRWFDESRNAYYVYARELLGRDAFETEYDFDAERLTVTYVGDRPTDASNLVVRVERRDTREAETRAFTDADELTDGDSTTVTGVSTNDVVTVELDVPDRAHYTRTTLVRFRVRPPRVYVDRDEGETVLYVGGRRERDAENFRILVDGEPAARQFADEYDTVSGGDELRLSEAPVGSEVVVEWTQPSDPLEIARRIVTPEGQFETAYDGDEGVLTVTYAEGDAVDAADLRLLIDGEPADVQPADDHDTFGPGDELAVPAPPFASVELVWVGPEDTREELARTITTDDAFEASYDADDRAVEIVYVGDRPADPSRVDVRHGTARRRDADDGPTAFEEAHDTLETGDGVRVSGVEPDDWVAVVLTSDEGYRGRALFYYTPLPRGSFDIGGEDGAVVAEYHDRVARDAEAFRILVDGEPADTQPDDVHDTLERGDEVSLGSLAGGTEVVVQWTRLDEPREVARHVVLPDATFSFERGDDGRSVTVEHTGGATLDAEDLVVLVHPADQLRRHDAWADEYDEVSEGDAVTVETAGDEPLKLAAVQLSDGGVLDYERFEE